MDNSKKFFLFIFLVLTGLVIAGLFISDNLGFSSGSLNQGLTGMSYLSLTQADLSSSSPYFRGENVWILSVVQGRLAQSAEIRLEPNDILAKTGKEKPTADMTLTAEYLKQQCEYPLQVDERATQIQHFFVHDWWEWSWDCSVSEARNKCPGKIYGYGAIGAWVGKIHCYVMCGVPDTGAIATIAGADIHSTIKTSIKKLDTGEIVTATLDTVEDQTHGSLGDKAYVVWQGNLDSGKSCHNKFPPWDKLGVYVNGDWRVINKHKYTVFTSKLADLEGEKPPWTSFSAVKEWLDNNGINRYAEEALKEINFGTIEEPSNIRGGTIIVPIQDNYQYPLLTYYIKADWIGIYTPAPEPKIVKLESECFSSGGKEADIKVTIRNIGDEMGSFEAYAYCPTPFYATRRIDFSLNAGDTKTISIPLSAITDAKIIKECTVYIGGVGYKKKATVDVCVDPRLICTPDKEWCEGKNIWKCNKVGSAKSIIKECPTKCIYEDSKPKCEGESPTPYCKNCFEWLGNLLDIKECAPKKADKVMGFIPIPMTAQDSVCPVYLIVVFGIMGLFVVLIVVLIRRYKK